MIQRVLNWQTVCEKTSQQFRGKQGMNAEDSGKNTGPTSAEQKHSERNKTVASAENCSLWLPGSTSLITAIKVHLDMS